MHKLFSLAAIAAIAASLGGCVVPPYHDHDHDHGGRYDNDRGGRYDNDHGRWNNDRGPGPNRPDGRPDGGGGWRY